MFITNSELFRVTVRLMAAILIWPVLCSCVSRSVEIKQYGLVQLRTYWMLDHLDWESNTWVEKQEVCPSSGAPCISAKQLDLVEAEGVLWVHINRVSLVETADAMYFFDTKTGTQLACPMCAQIMSEWWVGNGYWLDASRRFVSFCGTRNSRKVGLLIATIHGAKIDVEILPRETQPNIADMQTYGNWISPDNRSLAWYECTPTCTLYWLNKDYSRILSEPTVCASKDLEVYWKDGRPMTGFFAGTSKFETCRDAKGELKYPLQLWKY